MSKNNKKGFFRLCVACFVAVFMLLVPLSALPDTVNADDSAQVRVTANFMQTEARSMLSKLNSWRAGNNWYYDPNNNKLYVSGLKALKYDYTLEKYAMQRAAEIIVSYEHNRPVGNKRTGLSGYRSIGENLAATTSVDGAKADHAMNMFKEENKKYDGQGHRRMMLSRPAPFDAVGFACVLYKDCYYWVQIFGETSTPNTTPTAAINGNRTLTVDLNTSLIVSKSADLTKLNNWDAKLSKGQTEYLPEVDMKIAYKQTWPYETADAVAVPTWTSSNTGVATVNSGAGTITGVNSGSSNLTMKEPITSTTKTKAVTVTDPNAVTGVTLNKTSLALSTGSSSTLTATVSPSSAANKSVTWSSSNTAVATVSSSGVVKALKAGTATITAKTVNGNKTAACKVTVSDVVPTSVSLNKTSASIEVGDTVSLTATVLPSNATNKTVTWTSSNTSVATVTNGKVKGTGAGTATITAKTSSGAKIATCKVTVDLYYKDSSGKIYTSYTGMAKVSGWRYFTKGKFDPTYTGLAKSPVNQKWYYINKGLLDTSYTGMAKSPKNGKWYYVTDGLLDRSYTGMAKSPKNGKWYYIVNGLLDYSFTGLAKSPKNGKWYYMVNSVLDYSYTGMAKSPKNGKWYYVKNSTLDSTFTGIAENSSGKWYMKKGLLDKTFNGTVVFEGVTYKVTNGKAVAI